MNRQFSLLTLTLVLSAGILLSFLLSGCSSAKQTAGFSDEDINQAIESDNWIFRANQTTPQGGRSRTLSSIYEVTCRTDSVLSHLPYFGSAYSAPIGETGSPLDFITTDYQIKKIKKDKGRWDITISPKDNRQVQSFIFNLFENGSAQLNVQMTSRSPISFSGSVRPGQK